MALYRFLFAPVLLAVAVLVGSGEKAATKQPQRAAAVEPARPADVVGPTRPAARPARAGRGDVARLRAPR